MLNLLSKLEPRIEEPNSIMYEELNEINEVIFLCKGTIKIGYEFNGVRKFPLVYKNANVIGAYNCSFNKKC